MFIAETLDGKRLSVFEQPLPKLFELKKCGPFFCPACREEVILKIGRKKTPHFAHKSICNFYGRGETETHIDGKKLLYRQLQLRGFNPELESHLPAIDQRPDIFFETDNFKVAVEFQCSLIPVEEMELRTYRYLKSGILPVWVVYEKLVKSKKSGLIHLTDFIAFFIRCGSLDFPHILSLSPENGSLVLYSNIMPYSSQRAFIIRRKFPMMTDIRIEPLKEKYILEHLISSWLHHTEQWLFHLPIQPGARKNIFLQYLYHRQLHPMLLPPEVGVPLQNMFYIYNPPIEWQAYIWLTFIFNKEVGTRYTAAEIKKVIEKELSAYIFYRNLPLIGTEWKYDPIFHYLRFLDRAGYIRWDGETLKIINKRGLLKNSSIDRLVLRKDFFRRYKGILINSMVDSKNI